MKGAQGAKASLQVAGTAVGAVLGPVAEGGEGERSDAESPGAKGPNTAAAPLEVRIGRRQYSPAYKLRVLAEADAADGAGAVGALLRREGLYSSHLSEWRKARAEGRLAAGKPAPARGRPSKDGKTENERRLERENAALRERLRVAELINEAQKKLCAVLGLTPAS